MLCPFGETVGSSRYVPSTSGVTSGFSVCEWMSNSTSPLCRVMISDPALPADGDSLGGCVRSVDETVLRVDALLLAPPPPQAQTASVRHTSKASALDFADRRATDPAYSMGSPRSSKPGSPSAERPSSLHHRATVARLMSHAKPLRC